MSIKKARALQWWPLDTQSMRALKFYGLSFRKNFNRFFHGCKKALIICHFKLHLNVQVNLFAEFANTLFSPITFSSNDLVQSIEKFFVHVTY